MTVRRGTVTAAIAAALAVAGIVARSTSAETADPAKQTATSNPVPTMWRAQVGTRPRGHVLDCSNQQAPADWPLSDLSNPSNLVVGPLIMLGARTAHFYSADFEGNKFPIYVRAGHRVTLEIARRARPGTGIAYGPGDGLGRGWPVVTFIACRRGERPAGSRWPGGPVSLWAGGIRAESPRCVPLLIWVDDKYRPRQAVINLGMRNCG